MRLSELKHRIWKDERIKAMRLRKGEVKVIVDVTIEHILKGLLEFGQVKLKGLFTLKTKEVKGRKIKNVSTGEYSKTEDYFKVTIEPSKALSDGLRKLRNNK